MLSGKGKKAIHDYFERTSMPDRFKEYLQVIDEVMEKLDTNPDKKGKQEINDKLHTISDLLDEESGKVFMDNYDLSLDFSKFGSAIGGIGDCLKESLYTPTRAKERLKEERKKIQETADTPYVH